MLPAYLRPHNRSPPPPFFLTDADQWFTIRLPASLSSINYRDQIGTDYFLRRNPQWNQAQVVLRRQPARRRVRKKLAVTSRETTATAVLPEKGARVPRISRLVALGVRMEGLVREGRVKNYAELARLGGISRARITQILNLRNLAPAIQERLLFLEEETGVFHERALRRVAQNVDWREQERQFAALVGTAE